MLRSSGRFPMYCATCTGPCLDLPNNERPGAYDVLAAAYSYAITSLYRLGHLDLSHLADERARAAAAHGDDPLRAAVAEWNHSLILMFDGTYPAALRSIERADADRGPRASDSGGTCGAGRAALAGRDHRGPRDQLRSRHRAPGHRAVAGGRRAGRGRLLRHQVRSAQRDHPRSLRADRTGPTAPPQSPGPPR